MIEQAYIRLVENHWAVVTGDGVHAEIELLAVGRPFAAGDDIREAVAELEDWAQENGFELTTPEYVLNDWSLEDLIEPEIFDEVFGDAGDAGDAGDTGDAGDAGDAGDTGDAGDAGDAQDGR